MHTRMRTSGNVALGIATAAALMAAVPSEAKDLTIGNWLPPMHNTNVHGLAPLIKEVETDSGGSLAIKFLPGGQLYGGKAALSSVGSGISDGDLIVPMFHQSELKNALVVSDLIFASSDPLAITGAAIETIMLDCKTCQDDYKKQGTVFLAGYSATEYNLMCKSRVESLADISGKKVRSSGGSSRVVQALGGVPVGMTDVVEAIDAMNRGAIDCVIGPLAWMLSYSGLDDIVKYVIRYPLGLSSGIGLLVMNKASWDGLTKDQKAAFFKNLPMASAATMIDGYMAEDEKALKVAKAKGVTFTKGGPEFDKIMEPFRKAEIENVAKLATKRGTTGASAITKIHLENAAKWDKIIQKIGHDKEAFAKALQDEVYSNLNPDKL